MSNTFDYIVVGAGSAGSVIAARLATARRRTLLLEGGEDTREGQGVLDSFNKFTWETGSIAYYFAGWSGYPIDLKTYTTHSAINHLEHRSNIRQGPDSLYSTTVGFRKEDDVEPPNGSGFNSFHANNIVFPRYYHYPRAAGAGGSAQHHAMVHGRGSSAVYDRIASIVGDQSWSGANIDRIWKKIENYSYNPNADASYHSKTGWLAVKRVTPEGELSNAMRKACFNVGIPETLDFNDPHGVSGFGPAETQIDVVTEDKDKVNERTNSFKALVEPILDSNDRFLTVKFNSLVSRVLFDVSGSVINTKGVEVINKPGVYKNYYGANTLYKMDGGFATPYNGGYEVEHADIKGIEGNINNYTRYYCNKEVIICGGFIQSPQILMLSGVGNQADLSAVGIQTIKNLPGVGYYMQDHNEQFQNYRINPKKYIPRWLAAFLLRATGLENWNHNAVDASTVHIPYYLGFGSEAGPFLGRTLNYNINHLTFEQKKAVKAHYMKFINQTNDIEWVTDKNPWNDNGIPHMIDWHSGWVDLSGNATYEDIADKPYPGMYGGKYDIQDPNLHIHHVMVGSSDFDSVSFNNAFNSNNVLDMIYENVKFYRTTADGSGILLNTVELRNRDSSDNPVKPNRYTELIPTSLWTDPDNKDKYFLNQPSYAKFNGFIPNASDPALWDASYVDFSSNVGPKFVDKPDYNLDYFQFMDAVLFDRFDASYSRWEFGSKEVRFFEAVSIDSTGLPKSPMCSFLNENLRSQNLAWIDPSGRPYMNNVKENTGRVKLRSNNPSEPPIMDMRLWKNDEAHLRMAKGTTLIRNIMNQKIMKQFARVKSVPTDILGNFVEFWIDTPMTQYGPNPADIGKMLSRAGRPLSKDTSGNWVDADGVMYYELIKTFYNAGGNPEPYYKVVKPNFIKLNVYNTPDASDNYNTVTHANMDIINQYGEFVLLNGSVPTVTDVSNAQLNPAVGIITSRILFSTISEADTWEWEISPGRAYFHKDASGNWNNQLTNEYAMLYLRKFTSYGHHGSGTCSMGPNPYLDNEADWVVDSKLKVRGINGLRVADTSIYPWPELHGYNTTTAAYVVGEIASEFILRGV